MQKKNGIIYLDNAATMPMRGSTVLHLVRLCSELYGNPSSTHNAGYDAMGAISDAQISIAQSLGCNPWDIYFTSGGTEADNWALRGVLKRGDHLITSSIEHHAILNTAKYLETQGVEVTYVNPTSDGIVHLKDIIAAKKSNTKLISLMLVNNEVGTIQPIEEIAEWAKANGILIHTDAVQAVGHMPINLKTLEVDMISASAHKFGGLKNSGFLFIRDTHLKGKFIEPLLFGGNQQNSMRPGTLDPVSISIMAMALDDCIKTDVKSSSSRDAIWSLLLEQVLSVEGVSVNGSIGVGRRLHNNINIRIEGVDAEALVTSLNEQGIYISAGAACSSGDKKPSHVLKAMGMSDEACSESVRITTSGDTTVNDIHGFIEKFAVTVNFLRQR